MSKGPRSPREIFTCEDMTIRFPWDAESGRIGLEILPTACLDRVVSHRNRVTDLPELDNPDCGVDVPARTIDPLVQIKVLGNA